MRGHKHEQARVATRAALWAARLQLLPWWAITHRFAAVSEDDPNNQAITSAMWYYRSATITWYLEKTVLLSDDELDALVVHELCHLLLDSITPDRDEINPNLEFATECVARTILAVAGR